MGDHLCVAFCRRIRAAIEAGSSGSGGSSSDPMAAGAAGAAGGTAAAGGEVEAAVAAAVVAAAGRGGPGPEQSEDESVRLLRGMSLEECPPPESLMLGGSGAGAGGGGRGLHSSTVQLNLSRFCHKIHPENPRIPPDTT